MSTTPSVVVIGAGLGGLCVGAHLKKAGIEDFVILEQAERVGGTWRQNSLSRMRLRHTGGAVPVFFRQDVELEPSFSPRPQVQRYTEDVVDLCGLRTHLRLGQGVASARWDDARAVWRITATSGEVREARALVTALGQLNRPKLPEIAGRSSFAGASFHSANWDHSVDLAGRRVGVIGSAASAVQLIPEVAAIAQHLTVFQRSPNWLLPRMDREVSDAEKRLLTASPEVSLSERDHLYLTFDTLFWQVFQFTEAGREFYTEQARNLLQLQVPDPELRRKLTPDYPIGCKRVLFADDYYPALMRPNVALVAEGIERIVPEGVVTADGVTHKLDALVYATGFETTGWRWSVDVVGRGGVRLSEVWKEAPEAYLESRSQISPTCS